MIVYSDNTATNLVLDKVGIKCVNDRMAGLGLKETRINAKVFKGSTTSVDPARTKQYGLGSTTARQMLTLLELLHEGELISADASKAMLEHMKKCDDKDKFPRFLPKGVAVAHKTGSVSDARTDAGLIFFKEGPVALVVLSSQNEDKSWTPDNGGNKLCADIARAVVEHYRAGAPKTETPKK
jgi:beta-lactamase class A